MAKKTSVRCGGRWRSSRQLSGLLFVVALVIANGPATAAPGDFIHADGTHLVDGSGTRFAIKGINLGNWLVPEGYMFKFTRARAPGEIADVIEALVGPQEAERFWTEFRDVYITEEDIRFIKAAGFNTVRVPLHWRLFVEPGDGSPDRFEGPGWRLLDRLVGWCRAAGLRVILDLHAAPGGQTGVNHDDGPGFPLVFYVPRYRQLTIALWRALAGHYRDDPTILGYDLLNEPISPYNDMDYLNPRLEPLYREIVAAIRGVDTNHAVLLAGAQWSISFAAFGRPFDANAIYTYHKFWAKPTRDSVQSYVDFSNRWKVPLLIGETGEFNNAWNQAFRELNEHFGIGWCFWPYKSLDTDTAVVSIPKPAGWELIAEVGSRDVATLNMRSLPPRTQVKAILDAYLEAAKFKNDRVNAGYLNSLGLAAP
ncbi:MAG: glycoside hydrolase family 5 protein [Xanthobacteraceae bacterium]